MPFTITAADISVPKRCPVFGFEMEFGGGIAGSWNSPSLDRIDNLVGYVPGNVQVISFKANMIKGRWESADLLKVGRFIRAQQQQQNRRKR